MVNGSDGLNVGAIRRRCRYTQAEFARLIGVRLVTVASWEQGRRRPSRIARRMLELLERHPEIAIRLEELAAAKTAALLSRYD